MVVGKRGERNEMLPRELEILKRALEGKRYYTFSGDVKLCRELEDVDDVLERIRRADDLTEVQAALDGLVVARPSAAQPELGF
jgi:nucleoside-diphosphate-sugar epimerase